MFAPTLWSVEGNMYDNLAQKLCQVLGKSRQLLGDFWGALPLDPTGGLPSPDPCMCHLHVPPILNRAPLNEPVVASVYYNIHNKKK